MKKECCNINDAVQEFYSFLKFYILKRVEDVETAEDLVQEVMVQLVEAHVKGTDVENIKAWLFQVTRNTLYSHYRNNPKTSEKNIEAIGEIHADDFSDLVAMDYIVPMIELLPKEYSEALMLSDIEKIPQKDIADKLGLGISATKMRIQRARTKLRELFVECCHLEFDKDGNFVGCTVKDSCEPLHKISSDIKSKGQN